MNQVPDNDHRPAEADEGIARLLRLAGHRPPIPEWDAAVVKRAAREEWREKVRTRARRAFALRAGGLLAAAVLAMALGLRLWPPVPEEVASVEAIVGSVQILPAPGGEHGNTLFAGTVVATSRAASGARAALRLAGGTAVRLDEETRLELVSATVLALEQGAVYVDSGGGAAVEVRTPLGVARDIGTRFEVRLEAAAGAESSLRIRVRDGVVDLRRGGGSERAGAGAELVVRADGSVERGSAPAYGPDWDWVLASAPAFDIEGRPLRELLDWFAREGGWELRFADAESEGLAAFTMHGSLAGSEPETGMESLLRGNGLSYRFEGGALIVEKR